MLSACSSTEEGQTTESTTTEETTPSDEKPSGPPSGMMGGGAVDKSSDTELQTMISEVEGDFEQLEYTY